MKKRTRVIAWIYLIFTGYAIWTGVVMILGLAHGYSILPWYLIAQMLLPVIECPFWLFLLRQRVWAWWPLIVIYSLLSAEWLYGMGGWIVYGAVDRGPHLSPVLKLVVSVYALVIVTLPLWALLTDRPGAWNRDEIEGHPQAND